MALRRRLGAELLRPQLREQLQHALGSAGLPGLQAAAGLAAAPTAAAAGSSGPGLRAFRTISTLTGSRNRNASSSSSDTNSSKGLAQLVDLLHRPVAHQWPQPRRWYVRSTTSSSAAALPDSLLAGEIGVVGCCSRGGDSRSSSSGSRNGGGSSSRDGGSSSRSSRDGGSSSSRQRSSTRGSGSSRIGASSAVGNSSSSSSSSGGGGGALSKLLLSRRRGLPGLEDESALSLPEVRPQDKAILDSAGGDAGKLLALLRQHRRTQLFNSALRTVPGEQLQAVVDELVQSTWGSGGSCRPDHLTVRTLLHRLARSDMHAEVNSFMQALLAAGLPPTYKAFLPWASFHARRGSVSGVRAVMAQVEAHGGPAAVSPHYYVQVVRAYCTAGRWKETDGVLPEMRERGVPPSDYVYRALIFANGRYHRADRARAVFDDMLARGVTPSVPTWSALVNAYAESNQPTRAIETLMGMRRQGLLPSVEAWGALTKAFARSGDWRRALEAIEVMQAEGLAPNEQVWGCAIEAAAVAGKPSVAEELLRRMQAGGARPNVIAFTSLLSAYGATRDVCRAEAVLQQMAAAGCRPNGKTYTELMAQLAMQGRYEDCERYFNQMQSEGWPADRVSYAILFDSMLHRWAENREGQPELLRGIAERWEQAASGGVLEPHTFLHQPQGRLTVDLHGYSPWTAQLAVLGVLRRLLAVHEAEQGGITAHLSRVDLITGRGNRSARRHRPVVREAVLEMLQHLLPVAFSRANDGLLVLEARHLRRLFDSMLAEGRGFSLPDMQHCLVEPSERRARRRGPLD
ncbi:hypothetical protein ABPG75_013244 [Micractinium tetrahymenae]